nr:hypothetical protein [Actinoallomurus iriomotensis]
MSSARLSLLVIAVATRTAKSYIHSSASSRGSPPSQQATSRPHTLPPTTMGLPIAERMRRFRLDRTVEPSAGSYVPICAMARPVRSTRSGMLPSRSGRRSPTAGHTSGSRCRLQEPTTIVDSSFS